MKNLFSLIILLTLNASLLYSQQHFEWQSKVFTVDSLPKNITYINVGVKKILNTGARLIAPVTITDNSAIFPYRTLFRKTMFYTSDDVFLTTKKLNVAITPDTFLLFDWYLFSDTTGFSIFSNYSPYGGGLFHKEFFSSQVNNWNGKDDSVKKWVRRIDNRDKRAYRNINYSLPMLSYTLDGGYQWIDFHEPRPFQSNILNDVYFIDSNSCYVHGYNSIQWTILGTRFYRSSNKGTTWESLGCPVIGYEADSSNNIMFRDIRFQNSTDGIAIGSIARTNGDSANVLTIFKTTNAGSSWYVVDTYKPEQEDSYMYIAPVQGDTIAVVLNYGRVKISYDNGTTWRWLVRNEPMLFYNNKWNRHGNMGRVTFLDSKTAVGYYKEARYTNSFEIIRLVPEGTVDVEPTAPSKLNGSTIWIEKMYPNPATKSITVETNVPFGTDTKSISIDVYDMLGSKVQHLSWSDVQVAPHVWGESWYNVTIPLRNLTNGIYILRYKSNEYENSKTFIHVE